MRRKEGAGRVRTAWRDQRGAVYLETLIAFVPVFVFFLGTLQLADASVAQLIVQHASTTAARAAVVVLPDDGAYYDDRPNADLNAFVGARRLDVERAADLILRANPRLHVNGANVRLNQRSYADRDDLIATVESRYRCLVPALCGGGIDLHAESKLVYQGAKFVYESNTGLLDNALDNARAETGRSMNDTTDPRAGEVRGQSPLADDAEGAQRPPTNDPSGPIAQRPPTGTTTPGTARPPTNDPSGPIAQRPPSGTTTPGTTRPPTSDPSGPIAQRPPSGTTTPGTTRPPTSDPSGPIAQRPANTTPPGGGRVDLTKPSPSTSPAPSNRRPPNDQAEPGQSARPTPPVVADNRPRPGDDVAPGATPDRPPTPREIEDALRDAFGCFVAGTGISTPLGSKPIESIEAGDSVYAYDEAKREVVVGRVTRTFIRQASAVIDLTIRTANRDEDEILTGTADHPFFVPELADYVMMGKLVPGTELLTIDGSLARVISLRLRHGRFDVFNFGVEGEHNYFALGSTDPPSAILVHNQTFPCQQGGGDEERPPSNDPPYSGREWRDHFEAKFGPGNVRSNTVPPRRGPNVRWAGYRHPNGIVFDHRGYPIFDDIAAIDLHISDHGVRNSSGPGQMREATRQLRDMIAADPSLATRFDANQLAAINSGLAQIPGYTWHHHQDVGRMQLVPRDVHDAVKHIGGTAMWRGR